MTMDLKEIVNDLDESIHTESVSNLMEGMQTYLHLFKHTTRRQLRNINPEQIQDATPILREIKNHIELLLKLEDFIDYVGELQSIMEPEED